ncbi:hypothetical protein VARIO8X_50443 [Burkholderiales bacterium 8X]|nr:hypothetical protein VARIO8X_50443 [Burkholderiales bacterium 8X]
MSIAGASSLAQTCRTLAEETTGSRPAAEENEPDRRRSDLATSKVERRPASFPNEER